MEVEVGVLPLGIHLDSLQARFWVRLEELEEAGVISEAFGKAERWLGMGEKGSKMRRRKRRRGIKAEGSNSGDLRGGNRVYRASGEEKRGGTVVAARGQERDNGVQMASRGLPQASSTTPRQSRFSWALQWLPDNNSQHPLSLRTHAR